MAEAVGMPPRLPAATISGGRTDESGQNPGSGDHRHAEDSAAAVFNQERDLQAGYTKFIFQLVATR